jgi:U3 small nucleolar RNA-associated protein 23
VLPGTLAACRNNASLPHLQELLSGLLGGEVRLYVTPCVSKELAGLGPALAPAVASARSQQLHKCGHSPAVAPCDCLLAAVAGGNPGHWWVASQDKALAAALANQPGVPLLFASVNGLHLAEPPAAAKAAVSDGHTAAQLLPAHEAASEALRDLAELRPRDDSLKAFRRKHARGPNPLSVKKKQQKPKQAAAAGGRAAAAAAVPPAAADEDAAAAAKRQRRRKKRAGDGGGGD